MDCCRLCKKEATDKNVSLFSCPNCEVIEYCSTDCQKEDWEIGHKAECPRIIEEVSGEPVNVLGVPEHVWDLVKLKAKGVDIMPLVGSEPLLTPSQLSEFMQRAMQRMNPAMLPSQTPAIEEASGSSSGDDANSARNAAAREAAAGDPSSSEWSNENFTLPKLFHKEPVPSPPSGLSAGILKPFHHLEDGTWLHTRTEADTYKILIDVYRLRIKDQQGDANTASTTRTTTLQNTADGFKSFPRLFDENDKRALLPEWWNDAKAEECVKLSLEDEGWSSFSRSLERGGVVAYYYDQRFGVQLRVFGEQVYGSPPPNKKDGTWMLKIMKMIESSGIETNVVDEY